jgi:hypothetical protein
MFGCTDPSQVLREIQSCERAFPDAYVRLVAFDPIRQVQVAGESPLCPVSECYAAGGYAAEEGMLSGMTCVVQHPHCSLGVWLCLHCSPGRT